MSFYILGTKYSAASVYLKVECQTPKDAFTSDIYYFSPSVSWGSAAGPCNGELSS